MTKYPIEVITSVERRRGWSREDKVRLVAACFEEMPPKSWRMTSPERTLLSRRRRHQLIDARPIRLEQAPRRLSHFTL